MEGTTRCQRGFYGERQIVSSVQDRVIDSSDMRLSLFGIVRSRKTNRVSQCLRALRDTGHLLDPCPTWWPAMEFGKRQDLSLHQFGSCVQCTLTLDVSRAPVRDCLLHPAWWPRKETSTGKADPSVVLRRQFPQSVNGTVVSLFAFVKPYPSIVSSPAKADGQSQDDTHSHVRETYCTRTLFSCRRLPCT